MLSTMSGHVYSDARWLLGTLVSPEAVVTVFDNFLDPLVEKYLKPCQEVNHARLQSSEQKYRSLPQGFSALPKSPSTDCDLGIFIAYILHDSKENFNDVWKLILCFEYRFDE